MAIPPLAVGNVIKVTLGAYCDNQIGEVNMHYRLKTVGAPLVQTIQLLANAWLADAAAGWVIVNSTHTVLSGANVELLSLVTGKVTQSALAENNITTGTDAVPVLPKQASAVLKKVTGLAGKKNRGRMFFPFIPQDFADNVGRLTPAAITAYNLMVNAVFGPKTLNVAANALDIVPVLRHGKAAVTFDDLTDILCSVNIGTQKKRGDYGRKNSPL